jgi:hypothetical protein
MPLFFNVSVNMSSRAAPYAAWVPRVTKNCPGDPSTFCSFEPGRFVFGAVPVCGAEFASPESRFQRTDHHHQHLGTRDFHVDQPASLAPRLPRGRMAARRMALCAMLVLCTSGCTMLAVVHITMNSNLSSMARRVVPAATFGVATTVVISEVEAGAAPQAVHMSLAKRLSELARATTDGGVDAVDAAFPEWKLRGARAARAVADIALALGQLTARQ